MRKYTLLYLFLFLATLKVDAQSLIRGPYLMVGTPNSIVVRWRTDTPTNSIVRYGGTASGLSQNVTDNALVTEHIVKLTGLNPKTRYFYSIGSTTATLQGDAGNYFETSPEKGEPGKYRFGVFGDCGTNSIAQAATRDKMADYLGGNYMNAWLLLGDNAYSFGSDTEYQSNFFNHYKDNNMKRSPLFPTPGNHDYDADNWDRQNDHNVPYYKVFSMPTQAEAGGSASNTQAFYSYDYGNVHFLSLDSFGREDQATRMYDTLGRQVQWIKADLAANQNKQWIIAYWHHPPYSQGSRNSETEYDMIKIRENFIRILERYGVDMIICGHSHIYERSRLMGGMYDYHNKFNPTAHNYSSSTAKYDGTDNSCPYIKSAENKRGTVYVVAGSAGHLGGRSGDFPHKAMYYSNNDKNGALLLEVQGNRLDAKWINDDGEIRDKFTMMKDVNRTRSQNIEYNTSVTLNASYIGPYNWSTGETGKTITVRPSVSTEYRVRDNYNCVSDVFKVNVATPLPVDLASFTGSSNSFNIVGLKWASTYEVNSAYFSIERSQDGKGFTEVGRVNAAKVSHQIKNYEWTDETSSNIVNADLLYYRLKIVALDGATEFSQVNAIKITRIDKSLDIEIIPNPSLADVVKIRLVGKISANGKMTITDQAGKIRSNRPITLTSTPSPFLPEDIPPGLYILKMLIDGTILTKKLVVY